MTRVVAWLLLFSYTLLSAGYVAVEHYCGERLVSYKIGTDNEADGCVCGHEKAKSCCSTDKKTATPEEQKISVITPWASPHFVALPLYFDSSYLPTAFLGHADAQHPVNELITGKETYPPPYKRFLRLLI